MSPSIHLLDVTNRDGVQTSWLGLAKLEKTIINILLDEVGVFQSEFGFPFTNHEINYLNANLALADQGVFRRLRLGGWCTVRAREIKKALSSVPKLKHMNVSISTSAQMIRGKFEGRITKSDVVKMMRAAVKQLLDGGYDTVAVNAEDASRTDLPFLKEFALAAKDAGAARLRYCDTLGFDDPESIHDRMGELATEVKLPLEVHCHNDLGMAVACSCAGAVATVAAGQDAYVNTCVNGMGERAGNADLVSVILALLKSAKWGARHLLDANVDLSVSWRIAKYASYAFSVPLPINQPGVGGNAFAHESGIHADGALKDSRNYELYGFEELGRGEPEIVETGRRITAGEYSGIKGFRNVYEKLEVEFKDDSHAARILELVRYANVHTQKPLTHYELKFIATHPDEAELIMTVRPPT